MDDYTENNELENPDNITMILSLDDGVELECTILTIFETNGKEYIALLPTTGKEAEEGSVFLYRYNETADGEPELSFITDDEYGAVADMFNQLLSEHEYDEIIDEEDINENNA